MPFHLKHRNFFVGLFIIIPVIAIPLLIAFSLINSEFLEKWYFFTARYDSTYGIDKGSTAVSIKGIKVGNVEKVDLKEDGMVDVTLKVKRKYVGFIKQDSKARLKQKNPIMGEWEIEITTGSRNATSITNGAMLESEVVQLKLDAIVNQVTTTITSLNTILNDIESGRGTIGKLITQDTLLHSIQAVIRNANRLVNQTHSIAAHTDSLVLKFSSVGGNANEMVDSLKEISSSVKELLADIKIVTGNLVPISDRLPDAYNIIMNDLGEAETTLKGIQNNWLIKSAISKPKERVLDGSE